ncbi:MAG TPA: transcriptional regulator NrdR [Chloroflexota bacterium]|nr:transcriptional regulator NrdR [Chloroflexota bacterium]
MRCPACNSEDLRVLETRDADEAIKRRRRCESCGNRFNTTERADAVTLLVVKRDARREEYDRNKVLRGVRIACEKRPIPLEAVEGLVDDVERDLARDGVSEVQSTRVGDLVIKHLLTLDPIAYIRFASVYREMKNLEAIRHELDLLLEQGQEVAPGP